MVFQEPEMYTWCMVALEIFFLGGAAEQFFKILAPTPLRSNARTYFETSVVKESCFYAIDYRLFEPRSEKIGLRGFRPGPTQTGLSNHWRWLEAWNFGFRKKRAWYYPCSENKDADQLRGCREADLRFCFRICKNPLFSRCGSFVSSWLFFDLPTTILLVLWIVCGLLICHSPGLTYNLLTIHQFCLLYKFCLLFKFPFQNNVTAQLEQFQIACTTCIQMLYDVLKVI